MKTGSPDIPDILMKLLSAETAMFGEQYAIDHAERLLVAISCCVSTIRDRQKHGTGHAFTAEMLQTVADQVMEAGVKHQRRVKANNGRV